MRSSASHYLTPSYGCEHETMESSKLSRASMTSEQRKLYESGMFFPERVLFTAKLDVKGKDGWEEGCPTRLTSQAFGPVPIAAITKIKYYRNSEAQKLSLKVTAYDQEAFFLVRREDVARIFGMIAWGKLATMNIFSDPEEQEQGTAHGPIFKKSYVFKSWELRHAIISKEKGLQLAKDPEGPFCLVMSSTSEVWTRFETIKSEAYLVIKLWHGLMKQEYAVPAWSAVRWIQAFCTLLTQK